MNALLLTVLLGQPVLPKSTLPPPPAAAMRLPKSTLLPGVNPQNAQQGPQNAPGTIQGIQVARGPAQPARSCPCPCPCAVGGACDCGQGCQCADCPGRASTSPAGWSGTRCDGRSCWKYEWVPDADSDHWLALKVNGKQVGAYCYHKQGYWAIRPDGTWKQTPLPAPLPSYQPPSMSRAPQQLWQYQAAACST